MELNIVTTADLEAMERRLTALIKSTLSQDKPKEIMTLDEACAYLGNMAKPTIRKKVCSGEIASYKAGGVKFRKADLDTYLASVRRASNDEIIRKA